MSIKGNFFPCNIFVELFDFGKKKMLNALFGRSPISSMFNMNEIVIVMDYIKKLLTPGNHQRVIYPSDIGVVTPYKMQRRCIAQACNRLKFDDITIGTAEVFQGQEKPVMIVSTVRSGGNRLGFVNNPRVCSVNVLQHTNFNRI